ncbi:hypothetical protein ACH4TV_42745 [Streptomyces sp. NPDC020898]|uniref:hypothetical protein n=1 Tax=Streptomyces sp. NPDC020898 TaxID=3365101 RepID=UPI0037A0A243
MISTAGVGQAVKGGLVREEVVAQPYEADRVAVTAGVDGGVGDELGHHLRSHCAELQLATSSPSGAEMPPVPGVFGACGYQPLAQLAADRGVQCSGAGDQAQVT